jgi:hypothetical protein
MTNQQIINAALTAIAATILEVKPSSTNLVEFEFVAELKELFNNPMFDTLKQDGFDKNLFAINKKSGIPYPTPKGFRLLFSQPETKVVTQTITKPVTKLTDTEVINTFVLAGKEICDRIPNGIVMQKKVYNDYNKIYDAASCVVDNINNFVSSLPVVEEVVETMPEYGISDEGYTDVMVEIPKKTREKKIEA